MQQTFTKRYKNKPESVLENEMHKILWGLEIQTDHSIPVRRTEQVLMNNNKRTCQIVNFVVPAEWRQKAGQILEPCQRVKNAEEHESDSNTNHCLSTWNNPQELQKDWMIKGRIETIQTSALLKLAWVLETSGNLLLFSLQWKTIS